MLPTIITCCNFGYIDISENLLLSIIKVVPNYKLVFYCLDSQTYDYFIDKYGEFTNYIFILFNSNSENIIGFSSYGSLEFNKITYIKLNILVDALSKYKYIHYVDSDVVFLKDPTAEYYEHYSEYDIVFQKDCPHSPTYIFDIWACTGNFVLKNTEATVTLINKVKEYNSRHLEANDQESLRSIFLAEGISDLREYKHANLSMFPPQDFACGFYAKDQTPRENHIDPSNAMVFHANHVCGKESKIALLKLMGAWYM